MVSFFITDKRKTKTSIRCSVQPKGMPRVCFTIPNSKINTVDWGRGRLKTGRGKQELAKIQQELDQLQHHIYSFYSTYYKAEGRYPNAATLFEFLKSGRKAEDYFQASSKLKLTSYFNEIIERRTLGHELTKGKKFSNQTIQIYNSLMLSLKEFEKHQRREFFYLEEATTKRFINEFENFLTSGLKMRINTVHNRLKTLKSFLELAVNEGHINFNPFKRFKKTLSSEETDVVVFTKAELKALEALDFSDNPYYDQIRDQYLFYLWSGIRKSDLKHFLRVVNPDSKTFEFRAQKTGERCEVPAFDAIKRLGEKYQYQFPEPMSDTTVLREIKNICKLIPTMNVWVEKKYTKGGVEVRELVKKYEMVVIHTARRTLATLLADHKLPYHQIMKITGHKKLTTLQKYIKSDANIDQMLEVGNNINV